MTHSSIYRRLLVSIVGVWLLVAIAAPAAAQSATDRSYVSGGLFADIKRFSGDTDQAILDGESVGGSVTVGTAVHPRWDLQISLDIPRFTATSREHVVTLQRTTYTLESITENQALSVATLVRFHAAASRKVRIGYLAGLSILRLRREFHTEAPEDTPSGLIPRPSATIDYAAAPTVGIDAAVSLGDHLAAVAGVHATVFRLTDTSGLYIRPRIALRYAF